MNEEKLKKMQNAVRIGGKGTPRRKKKVVHATAATDDKKLQSSLKKLSVSPNAPPQGARRTPNEFGPFELKIVANRRFSAPCSAT